MPKPLYNTVSVHKNGAIAISRDLYEVMGKVSAVEILIDRKHKAIALKLSEINDEDSYRLHISKDTVSPILYIRRIFTILGFTECPVGRKKAKWNKRKKVLIIDL